MIGSRSKNITSQKPTVVAMWSHGEPSGNNGNGTIFVGNAPEIYFRLILMEQRAGKENCHEDGSAARHRLVSMGIFMSPVPFKDMLQTIQIKNLNVVIYSKVNCFAVIQMGVFFGRILLPLFL
jgi:hypothetical protein